MGLLSNWMKQQKEDFLHDLKTNSVGRWTIVMGNEAGDLDTVASSVAYSYLSSTFRSSPTIALQLTARPDLRLRAENLLAFQRAKLANDHQDFLCIDDLPNPIPQLSKFALVDHNHLTPFLEGKGKVVAILDHHEDEGLYEDANPREIVVPLGSCTSLVTHYFQPDWEEATDEVPPEVASLLLSAILIDTSALKPGGKGLEIDRQSATFLFPLAGFTTTNLVANPDAEPADDVEHWYAELSQAKYDVSRLGTRDLLRRDYKEYFIGDKVRVGLSTVPLQLQKCLEKDPQMWTAVDAWIQERKLDVAGLLHTYLSDKKGKHRRQLVIVLREGADPKLKEAIWKGLEASEELELQEKKELEATDAGQRCGVWQQGNAHATRKQIAPLMSSIVTQYVEQV